MLWILVTCMEGILSSVRKISFLIYLVLMSSPEKLKAEQVVEHFVPRLLHSSSNGKAVLLLWFKPGS